MPMGCYGCRCNFCARNCELFSKYFTYGEISDVSEVCYTCDECRYFGGDYQKKSMFRKQCDGYREAAKYTEAAAIARRKKLRVIKGQISMIREEAIINREKCLEYLEGIGPMETPACVEAVRWSLKALRAYPAKLDRSRWEGCRWCKDIKFMYGCIHANYGISDDGKIIRSWEDEIIEDENLDFEFCPNCGRPLTEKAWMEIERRINDGTAK